MQYFVVFSKKQWDHGRIYILERLVGDIAIQSTPFAGGNKSMLKLGHDKLVVYG